MLGVEVGFVVFLVDSSPEIDSLLVHVFVHFHFVIVDFEVVDDNILLVRIAVDWPSVVPFHRIRVIVIRRWLAVLGEVCPKSAHHLSQLILA